MNCSALVFSEYGRLDPDLSVVPVPGQLYGLEKFWAFLKYSKNKSMEIDPKLQEFLSKFKRLEDFRIDVSGAFCPGSASRVFH